MKKTLLTGLILSVGINLNAFASAGSARDGFLFSVVLVGLLAALGALLMGIDYLKRNGRRMLRYAYKYLRGRIVTLRVWINRMRCAVSHGRYAMSE
ncbi:MAG TPA: hypothetical protein VMC08_07650 [Bacteroidales bacterium]|nr:hypothetical protein [Bacteroidales bacterium]